MRYFLLLSLFVSNLCLAQWPDNYAPTYAETIQAYKELAEAYPQTTRLTEAGLTDSGKNLHTFIIDSKSSFDPSKIHGDNRLVCLIMNGIHPGEPCGINASFSFASAKAANPDLNVVYVIIPVYNIGGALNRNGTSRVNQDGPEAYGFRGNAKNLDLNRDFIKTDSKNTISFAQLYHAWKPEIFVDTHTSNGADYQATMTLIHTFPEKLHPLQASILTRDLLPLLYEGMQDRGETMTPYVHTVGKTPESGIRAFTDLPRYSSGYVALFNTISFMPEAHMLKPFDNRVAATQTFLHTLDSVLVLKCDLIVNLKKVADKHTAETKSFVTKWKLSEIADSILFSGYRADSIISEVTGLQRIRYNRDKPFAENIPYYDTHESNGETDLPAAFIIPSAYTEIAERLSANNIIFEKLKRDTTLQVRSIYIEKFETGDSPYEGHYYHFNTDVRKRNQEISFHKGDLLIRTNQAGNRYLAHVLNPENDDSFFNWNFFDAVLGQKEYFSDYLFEDSAPQILKRNPELKKAFEQKKRGDSAFANSASAQLDYIYRHSPHYETSHMRIPVFEIVE